jgi:ubiquitin-protein ligase
MASPRTRRLKLDYEMLQKRFAHWAPIQMTGSAGLPPEAYRFTYALKGIYVGEGGEILERSSHVLEVNLSLEYPRRPPHCRMLTPVFHPNFDDASVCIGDFWAASEGLDDLVVRIGRMIAYQEYNTRSPLNGLAAKWAAEHQDLLPIDDQIVAPPFDGDLASNLTDPAVPQIGATVNRDLAAEAAGQWPDRIIVP